MSKNIRAVRQSLGGGEQLASGRNESRIEQICRELERTGVIPLLSRDAAGAMTTGVALSVNARHALSSSLAASRFRDCAFDALLRRQSLAVTIDGLGSGLKASELFGQLCEILRIAAVAAHAKPTSVEIAIPHDALSPQFVWLQRRESLGDGPIYLLADSALMRPRGQRDARRQHDQFWLQLWHLRDSGMARAAYASLVSSQCPLLSVEVAGSIHPTIGLQVPRGTAWVPIELKLLRFSDHRGKLNETALRDALQTCVDLGDALHDHVLWPTAQMRHDAWLNRRLAIVITGVGDLAVQRQLDPQSFKTLQSLSELLRWMQSVLRARSRQVARRTENIPALELCDPTRTLSGGKIQVGWSERWREAVNLNATRHRNLMVLSPWSVFPAHGSADARYIDLLPLLEFADACAFLRPPSLACWKVNEFKVVHQRAWAVLEQKYARLLFAE